MLVTDLLTSLGICVLLPVLIVWLVLRARKHEIDRKTEILLKAMEAGIPIDENMLKSSKKPKSITSPSTTTSKKSISTRTRLQFQRKPS